MEVQKALWEKNSKENKQTLAKLNSVHLRSQAKCPSVQTSHIKQIKLFLFVPDNKHLINWAGGLYVRILTSIGLYSQPWSRFSHTDLSCSVNER